ncbi:ATP-binding protein [Caldivirga maquilingensis]|uniref:4Fe-4S ferredoxin iron-sulfur binding domain protein n=1 Tax=Caldivirga maquilingensis (strain ATCC 700844 / DSM 13496 / JCM 10307 / IC-167) TaxID=397948 RepID=A8ME00_CALMQ|nr:4Fe-4S binding protein [Caldivirga maquilingensis]ABW02006.1 4Fe-4S ferredoxin iron-sulfur binding domain protein [Caldivirga maquilingensis IC-167]
MKAILQRSPIVSRLTGSCGYPVPDPVAVAQGMSMTSQDSLTVLDTYGFIRHLGELTVSSVRGSMVIAVIDLWDIRPLCRLVNLPCLEPWDEDSLSVALNEAFQYSSVVEKPYIIRLNPLLSRSLCPRLNEVKVLVNRPVFNRNWGIGNRWRLPEQWGNNDERVKLILSRAREHVKSGDVLVEGYLPADSSASRSLYVNPLPINELSGVKIVEEARPFMINLIKGVNPNVEFKDSKAKFDSIVRDAWRVIDNGPIDPAALIRFCLLKLVREGRLGNVPIVVSSPYLIRWSETVMRPDYNPNPTYFMPRNINDITDATHINPLALVKGIGDYSYGSKVTVVTSCDVYDDAGDGSIVIINDQCPPPANVSVIEVNGGVELDRVCQLITSTLDNGGVAWIRLSGFRSELKAVVDRNLCDLCGDCIALKCSAITTDEQGYPRINTDECIGCGLCVSACSRGAITLFKPGS